MRQRGMFAARGIHWMLVLALGVALSIPLLARASEPFILSSPRFEPESPEAYGLTNFLAETLKR